MQKQRKVFMQIYLQLMGLVYDCVPLLTDCGMYYVTDGRDVQGANH